MKLIPLRFLDRMLSLAEGAVVQAGSVAKAKELLRVAVSQPVPVASPPATVAGLEIGTVVIVTGESASDNARTARGLQASLGGNFEFVQEETCVGDCAECVSVARGEFDSRRAAGVYFDATDEFGISASELDRVRQAGKSPIITIARPRVQKFAWKTRGPVLVVLVYASATEPHAEWLKAELFDVRSRVVLVSKDEDVIRAAVSAVRRAFV
jgi:NAD-dependent dihydropyrimidine dehydrogenase PreA subunit